MNHMKNRKRIILFCIICIAFTLLIRNKSKSFAQEDLISETKQGIVEIYSGFYSEDGVFHQMKHASGFLVSNQESRAYIVTVYDALRNKEKKKKSYCKKHGIPYENNTLDNSIQVVIKGDVTIDASILTESEKENYSILQVDSSISEKKPVTFGSNRDLVIGDTVYALGFAEDAGAYDDTMNRHMEFAAMDVKVEVGNIQDTGANSGGVLYLQHSAFVHSGNTGGPLLNENGYIIGLNNVKLNEDGTGVYYSLPIDNIRGILDNFEVPYQSIERMEIFEQYRELLEKSEKLLENSAYKTASKEELQEAMNAAKNIVLDENTDINEINEISEQLIKGETFLQLKMKTTRKAVIVLGVIIVLLTIYLIPLIVWKWKNKKEEKIKERETIISESDELESRKKQLKPEEEQRKYQQDQRRREYKKEFPSREERGEGTVLLGTSDPFFSDFREQSDKFYRRNNNASIKNLKTGKVLPLRKTEIYIGTKEEMNDFVVRNNSNVSRRHACISWEDGDYYIQDLQSSNGTFLNNASIDFGNKYKLKDKDKIVLANEEFLFYETGEEMYR